MWAYLAGWTRDDLLELGEPITLIEGGAKGADALAAKWVPVAEEHWTTEIEHLTFQADWDAHGRGAGPIRNQRMLDEGKPDLVLAFVDKPLAKSRGTSDMVRRAKAAGIQTIVVIDETSTTR